MIIIPAIDLIAGNCVRLEQGDFARNKVYGQDPAAMAMFWQDCGAPMIHLINLDGAAGRPEVNARAIEKLVKTVSIPVQLGGGIRSVDQAGYWLKRGIFRVIIGTIAITQPDLVSQMVLRFGASRLIAGLDARDGRLAIRGWSESVAMTPLAAALQLQDMGIERIIFTDIGCDGLLQGPNFDATKELASNTSLSVIASGGFASEEHFQTMAALGLGNIEGAIVGKALYEKKLEAKKLWNSLKGWGQRAG